MADPFEVLRTPVVPADPSPVFAARLRARLEQALGTKKGRRMLTRGPDDETTILNPPVPRPGDIAYVSLWVPDVERATVFFAAVLDWRYRLRVGHTSAT